MLGVAETNAVATRPESSVRWFARWRPRIARIFSYIR